MGEMDYRLNVGICLLDNAGRIFAAQRIDTPGPYWQMPQGGIDANEDPLSAALRELKEEIGTNSAHLVYEFPQWLAYDLPPDLQGKLWGGNFKGQKQKWFVFKFNGQDHEINIATEHPEFSHWSWMPPQELLENVVPFKKEIYELIIGQVLKL